MKSITLNVGGPHEVILGDFPFFTKQAPSAVIFFPNPFSQVLDNHHLALMGGGTQFEHYM